MNAPRWNCPDKTVEPNCHMTCEKYLAFQAQCEALRRERLVQRRLSEYQTDAILKNGKRANDRITYRSRMK